MRREPHSASHTVAIRTDRNQRGIDLKFIAKTIRMSAMTDALTKQRMRMRMMRLVNNNLATALSAHYGQEPFILLSDWDVESTIEAFARSSGLARFSDLPNWLNSA